MALNAKTPWQELLEDYAHLCIRRMETFARKEWGFPDTWEIATSVRFTPPRRTKTGKLVRCSSWGGVKYIRKKGRTPYVIIQLRSLRTMQGHFNFPFGEYSHIENDLEIGKLDNNPLWERYVAALCAHEVAHAVQHTALTDIPEDAASWLHDLPLDRKGHGEYWQAIYRVLRKKFVNDYDALPVMTNEDRLPRHKRRVHKAVIGRVMIKWGEYRNRVVYGNFDLVKSWQPKKEWYRKWDSEKQKYVRTSLIDFGEGKNGFVTIYWPKHAKVIRVSCDRDDVIETLDVS